MTIKSSYLVDATTLLMLINDRKVFFTQNTIKGDAIHVDIPPPRHLDIVAFPREILRFVCKYFEFTKRPEKKRSAVARLESEFKA